MIAEESIRASPALRCKPPLEDKLDWRQLRALINVYMKQGLRPAAGARAGKAHPTRRMVVTLGVLGAWFSYSGTAFSDLPTYLTVLFTAAFGLTMLSVLPDTHEIRQRNQELLASKPISQRTHLVARAAIHFFYAALIASCFGIVPLAVVRWRFYASWALIAGLYLFLAIGCVSAVVIWLRILLVCSRWLHMDRIRRISQLALVIFGPFLSLPLLARFPAGFDGPQSGISFAAIRGTRLLPPAWFATFLLDDSSPDGYLFRIAAVLAAGFAIWVAFSPSAAKNYPALIEKMASVDDAPARRPLMVAALARLRSLPPAGWWIAQSQAYGVASLIAAQTSREDQSRLRSVGYRFTLAFFFVMCFAVDHDFFLPMVAYLSFVMIIAGVDVASRSSHSSAAWVFGALPIEGRRLLAGLRAVILLKYFSLPFLLAAVVCVVYYQPVIAALLLAAFAIEANILVSLLLAIRPRIPLAQEYVPGQNGNGLIAGFGFNAATAVLNVTLYLLASYCGVVGVVLGSIALLMLVAISYGLGQFAVDRLASAEIEL